MEAYCDLCVEENGQTQQVLERLFSYNYHFACINRNLDLTGDELSDPNAKEARKRLREAVGKQLQPIDLSVFDGSAIWKYAKVHGTRAKLLSRLTIRFESVEKLQQVCQLFATELSNNFDIVAVCPLSEAAFNFACDQMSTLDLIQLNTTDKPKFRMSHQMVRRARSRNLHFEILLVPMLKSSSARAYSVSVAQNFVDITSGRSLILSSGAQTVWDVRNHVGMISVAAMLGVRHDLAPHCIRDAPKAVMKHALIRTRTIYGAMAIEKLQCQPGVKSVTCVPAEPLKRLQPHDDDLEKIPNRLKGLVVLDDEPPRKKKKNKKKSL